MPFRRVWIDWSSPLLPAAAAWLLDQSPAVGSDRRRDLSGLLCVVSGRRSGRVLLAQLLQQAQERSLPLIPPVIVTPGSMIERLLADGPQSAVANAAESQLAWMSAFQRLDSDALRFLVPSRPDDHDLGGWRALADIAAKLFNELSGQQLSFGVVAERAEQLEFTGEGDRWRALEKVEQHYHRVLQTSGLVDSQYALSASVRQQATAASRMQTVVLIGVVDLNATQRLALAPVADRVVTIVHAPADMADRFDDFGCIRDTAWGEVPSPLADQQIIVVERPTDQAQAVLRVMSEYDGAYAPSQITIGMGDAELAPVIGGHGHWAGVPMRAVGQALHQDSAPHRFLAVAADWLEDRRFATLTTMLRHPDVDRWLAARWPSDHQNGGTQQSQTVASWLSLLDRYFSDHLQEKIDGGWLGSEDEQRGLKVVSDAINKLLAPLVELHEKGRQPLGAWATPILNVLGTLYGDLDDRSGSMAAVRSREACFNMRDALADVASAPVSLQPLADAVSAIRHVLAVVALEPLTESLDSTHVEMLGWLELHTDLAPALIIVGFNEGFIPESVTAEAFLPDSLRASLGLMCNARRYARDAYLLHAIVNSRPRVTVIAGRMTSDGDPLTPSRLLLAGDDQTLLRRVRLVSGSEESPVPVPAPMGLAWPSSGQPSRFVIPQLPALATPTSLRVTDFRKYLACPYRFALERIVGLDSLADEVAELDALHFGNLAHDVLQALGEDPSIARSTESSEIEAFLESQLNRRVLQRYGRRPPPAVQVQTAQLRARFRAFAIWQAGHASGGWRIMHCEHALHSVALHFDDPAQPSMPVTGKIDRIDRHELTGEWMIADYKTGDSGQSPHKSHHNSDKLAEPGETEWVDLQLPLYEYLARQPTVGISGHVRLGYIVLPRQTDGATFLAAEWSADHLHSAIDAARHVVSSIRAGRFELNPEFDSTYDSFGRICQSTVLKGDEEDGDEGRGGEV